MLAHHAYQIYLIDLNIIYQIFSKNIWYISKVLLVAYVLFYWLPIKLFPQEHTGIGVKKIVFNFIYMVAYIETVVTFLIFLKIFSLLLFFFVIIATKLAFLKWYYKKDLSKYLNNLRVSFMIWSLNFLENPKHYIRKLWKYLKSRVINFQQTLTFYTLMQKILLFSVFFYIIAVLVARGLYSYSNPAPDTSQFIEWVDFLQQNMLYPANKTFGADFYGISVLIFFVNIFTNINQIILFSLYPVLLLLALYLAIYYIIKDFSGSKYVAIFAVIIHGLVLMTPFSNEILGKIVTTSNPLIVDWFGLKFYIPDAASVARIGIFNGHIPYMRYMSAMAYEHSSVFVILNIYFFIKTLQTRLNSYLVVYTLTLMLVFIFHGGGAIVLVVMSLFVTANAIIFRKIDFQFLKKGIACILGASIIGNLWILSMIKYGIPEKFGAAAPFIDKLLGNANSKHQIVTAGIESVSISQILPIHLILVAMAFFAFFFSFFTKKRFLNSSFSLVIISIFFVYFMPNLGFPLLTKQSRLVEYLFFAITFLSAFYFFFFFYKPIFLVFKRYARSIILLSVYAIFILLSLTMPKWIDTDRFWKNINGIEYTSISDIILKINRENRPFTWTAVSYVQEYAKVKNIGYHINTQNFLLRYNPTDRYLKIPTPKIFIFVENFPNPYKGMNEWYYRWRGKIQNNLKSWIALYSLTHKNIKIYQKTKTTTVYEIDNKEYMDLLRKKSENENK